MSSKPTRSRAVTPADPANPPAHDAASTAGLVPVDQGVGADSADHGDDDEGDDDAPTYDPAEYRWVPVRRRPRMDGWTEEKQRRFIETLADTGLVSAAAKVVGMGRESAYRLRRSPHGAAFARAWDAARHHAGGLIEDIAFERAIEGEPHDIFDDCGNVVCTRRTYNNRLMMFLLGHLKPERYGRGAPAPAPTPAPTPANAHAQARVAAPATGVAELPPPAELTSLVSPAPAPTAALTASLRDLEPPMPAPAEQLLDPDTLADALELADAADGELPHHLREQAPILTPAQERAAAIDARYDRGKAAWEKRDRGEPLTDEEFRDECFYLDPYAPKERPRRLYR